MWRGIRRLGVGLLAVLSACSALADTCFSAAVDADIVAVTGAGSDESADSGPGVGAPAGDVPLHRYEVGPYNIDVGFAETDDGADVIIAESVVPRAPDVVWRVLTDYANHPAFFQSLTSSRLLDPTTLRHEGEAVAVFFSYPFTVTFRVEERRMESLRFTSIDGDFTRYDGGWFLSRGDDGSTRLRYEATVQPTFYVPRWVMRIMIKNMTLNSSRAFIDRCLEQPEQ